MLKRRIRNELQDDLTTTEKSIARVIETIERLRSEKLGFNPEVMLKKNMESLKKLEAEKECLLKKIDELDSSSFDEKLKKDLEETRKNIQVKTDLKKKKKSVQQETSTTKSKEDEKKVPEQRYVSEYSVKKDENRYLKDCAALPDYMLDKLHNMPNNVGYIWRDIWCFGYLPIDRDEDLLTMHEKANDVYFVHVYNRRKQTYTLYKKDSMGKKIFISSKMLQSLQ